MVGALLLLLGWAQVAPATRTSGPVLLYVRVYPVGRVDRSTIERVQGVAGRLLVSAGIELVWRLCDRPGTCVPGTRPPGEIPVVLSAVAAEVPTTQPGSCGRAALDARAGSGSVWLSVACVAGVAARIASSTDGTAHPLLNAPGYDDVLGAIEAHELGHVLGLQHGGGLMRSRLDARHIVSLRFGTLAFTRRQSARMRAVLSEQTGKERAERRSP